MTDWISAQHLAPPAMETVLLCIDYKVICGWNEAIQEGENPSYCSNEPWPEEHLHGQGVRFWAHLPKVPVTEEDFLKGFVSVKDRLPDHMDTVFVKTDCDDCPIGRAMLFRGKWVPPAICQCDKHYETDEKFQLIGTLDWEQTQAYADRITHWRENV